jgi:hypothetical protein
MDLRWGKLVGFHRSLGPHLIEFPQRRGKLTHQSGRTCVHEIYGLENNFHHNNRKFIASDVQPFRRDTPFEPSKFGSEQG